MIHLCLSFLRELIANNHKEWFDANRQYYKEAQDEFNRFVDRLISEVRLFDPFIGELTAKDCVYRIYRDVRFSNDKTPYKNHFGAFIAQGGGRKSPLGGYYFHIEPVGAGFLNNSMWAGGIYCPDALTLKAICTDIFEQPREYKAIIQNDEFANTFKWFDGNMLTTAPKGFPKDFPDIDLLKHKDYTFYRNIDEQMLQSDRLLEESIRVFKLMLPFNRFMNRAILYHHEVAS
jgi:uncharacterized protein (TIGR02453 family)